MVQMCSVIPEQDTSLMSVCTSAAEAQVMTGLDRGGMRLPQWLAEEWMLPPADGAEGVR